MMIRFSHRAGQALIRGWQLAVRFGLSYIGTEHILTGITLEGEGPAFDLLSQRGLTADILMHALARYAGKSPADEEDSAGEPDINKIVAMLTPRTKRVVEIAGHDAGRRNNGVIEPEHLLMGILIEGENFAARILQESGINRQQFQAELARASATPEETGDSGEGDGGEEETPAAAGQGGAAQGRRAGGPVHSDPGAGRGRTPAR